MTLRPVTTMTGVWVQGPAYPDDPLDSELWSTDFSQDNFKWLYFCSNSFNILVSKGEFDLGRLFVRDVEAVHFLAKLWSWQTHLSTHHNHVTPLHLMHLLARFPNIEHAAQAKTIDFVHADIFWPLVVTLEKTATIKVSLTETSKNFPLGKWYKGKSNSSFYHVAGLEVYLPSWKGSVRLWICKKFWWEKVPFRINKSFWLMCSRLGQLKVPNTKSIRTLILEWED